MTEQKARGRRQLLLMALFFWGPLIVAAIVYFGFDWRPAGSTQHGTLLSPPITLPDFALGPETGGQTPRFRHRWTLLIVEPGGCAVACQRTLYETRQVREALSRDRDRTQRVLIIEGDFDRAMIEAQHPDLTIVTADMPVYADLSDTLAGLDNSHIYLVDTLGNLMMSFPRDAGMKMIHADVKKLLKLSSIG